MTINDNKYPDSPRNLDLASICTDKAKLGPLTFDNSLPLLEKIKEYIVELEDLDYKDNLTVNEAGKVESVKNDFLNSHVKKIQNFQVGVADSMNIKINIERDINNFYNTALTNLRPLLTALRLELQSNNKTQKELQLSLTNAKKLEKELREKIQDVSMGIEKDKKEVEKGKGVVSAQFLSKEFDSQFSIHEDKAETYWYPKIRYYYIALFGFAVISFGTYVFIREKYPNDSKFLIEWAIFSLLIISLFFYGLNFSNKNFNIQKNLAALNKHRRNVAQTFQGFLNSGVDDNDIKNALLKESAEAMFKNESTGYLSKDQMQITTPIQEMVTKIVAERIK